MENITIDYLLNHTFEESGLEEATKPNASKMFSEKELSMLPGSDQERFGELNIKISDMIYELFDDTRQFSQKSNLNYETVRKYISVGSKKTLTKEMLAKFVVACRLSVDEANELFELQDHALQPERIRLDAVVVHCLQNKLDIDGFFDTCEQVGLDIAYKIQNEKSWDVLSQFFVLLSDMVVLTKK